MKNIKTFEAFTEISNDELYLNKIPKIRPINNKGGIISRIKDILYDVPKAKELISNVKWEDLVVKQIDNYNINNYYRVYFPDYIYTQLKISKIKFDCIEFKIEDMNFYNRTHTTGIPDELKKLGFGYKCYKAVAKKIGWITSSNDASGEAMFVWKKLIKDDDFYSILSNESVVVIDKSLSKERIKKIILFFLSFHSINIHKPFDKDFIKRLIDKNFVIKLDHDLKTLFSNDEIRKLDIDLFNRYKKMYLNKKGD